MSIFFQTQTHITKQVSQQQIISYISFFTVQLLSVVLYSEEGDYPKNSHVVVCSNSDSVLFNLLICLELVLER